MPCTTILVGKKASYDGSTIVARNEDSPSGVFTPKKFIVVHPEQQPKIYRSVLSHVEIPLPEQAMRYTAVPNATPEEGIWGAAGVNSANVSMSATETITSNERVLSGDPLVIYQPAKDGINEQKGGIGEEDFVSLILPYIHTAREGVLRLGELLRTYGTYEMNGIAFQDKDEIWWLETIGGHHWIAKRVGDEEYVVMPNQLGIDYFDLEDAFGPQMNYLCSEDLREFIRDNYLDLANEGDHFNPRIVFGSHSDADHVYNTPRSWVIARYFNPTTYRWDGEFADLNPMSDNIPFNFIPEKKITIEDVKYVLSHHFQGTPYDPYARHGDNRRGIFRPIGINRNNVLACVQIRPYGHDETRSIQWIAYGSNVFNALVPFYTQVNTLPEYVSKTSDEITTDNFYWSNRLIGALADPHFGHCASRVERYQNSVQTKGHSIIKKYDRLFSEQKDTHLLEEANKEMSLMIQSETNRLLAKVLYEASCLMKNGFSRSDA